MTKKNHDADQVRRDWLDRLQRLIDDVRSWASADDWVARQIEINKQDSTLGPYKAPALLLQAEATCVLLEPIARSVPGVSGVVDLYLMPAYDDIARLHLEDDGWHIEYRSPLSMEAGSPHEPEPKLLTAAVLREVLDEMKKNVVH